MLFNFVSKKELLTVIAELQRIVAKHEFRITELEMAKDNVEIVRKPAKAAKADKPSKTTGGYVSRYKTKVALKSDLAKGHIVLKDATEIGIDSKIAAKLSKGYTLKDKHATRSGWIAKMNPKQ